MYMWFISVSFAIFHSLGCFSGLACFGLGTLIFFCVQQPTRDSASTDVFTLCLERGCCVPPKTNFFGWNPTPPCQGQDQTICPGLCVARNMIKFCLKGNLSSITASVLPLSQKCSYVIAGDRQFLHTNFRTARAVSYTNGKVILRNTLNIEN